MDIVPAKKFVVLRPKGQEKTKSGLIMPETDEKGRGQTGIVLAIGAGKKPIPFEVGDTIIYKQYMGNATMIGGEYYAFLEFDDICGYIPKKEEK